MAASLTTPSCTWRRNAHAEEVIVDVAVLLVVVLKVLVSVVVALFFGCAIFPPRCQVKDAPKWSPHILTGCVVVP